MTCVACQRPFVVAELLCLIDDGLYLLLLRCADCGHAALAEAEDAAVERLEAEHDAVLARMAAIAAAGAVPDAPET